MLAYLARPDDPDLQRKPGRDGEVGSGGLSPLAPTIYGYSVDFRFGRGIMVSRRDVAVDRGVPTVPAGVLLALVG